MWPAACIPTVADFEVLSRNKGLTILARVGRQLGRAVRRAPNLLVSVAVFKIERG